MLPTKAQAVGKVVLPLTGYVETLVAQSREIIYFIHLGESVQGRELSVMRALIAILRQSFLSIRQVWDPRAHTERLDCCQVPRYMLDYKRLAIICVLLQILEQ